MALIERLMHYVSEPETRFMSVHQFFSAVTELLLGNLTAVQIQAFYNMTSEDLADWTAIAALIPPVGEVAARAFWVEHIHATLMLAEDRVPTFSTPAEVRTRLGI